MMDPLTANSPDDFTTARYMATAVDLAYYPEAIGSPKFLEELGLDAHLVSVSNTQAYVGGNDTSIVVAFRGSESPATLDGLRDWLLNNANNFLVVPEGRLGTDFAAAGVGARFHRGFISALGDIWDPMFAATDALMQAKERPLFVTGHSLGGALALMAAWRFSRQFMPVQRVYTFGAPMIGNELAAKAFEKEFAGKIFRYVDSDDFVPKLPAVSLIANSYLHCQSEVMLGAGAGAAGAMKSMAGSAVDGVLSMSLMDELWNALTKQISAHLMGNYQSRIKEKLG